MTMSQHRISPQAGYVDTKKLPKGPNGRSLCRQCGQEVPKGQRSFCGQDCVDAWVVKTNPTRMREVVFKRDQGVCAICGANTDQLRKDFNAFCKAEGIDRHSWSLPLRARQWLQNRGIPPHRKEFWDADHIVPVIEGGGECTIDNLRTLCIPCHKQVTKELAARRAEQRRLEHIAQLAEKFQLEGLTVQGRLL